MVGPTRCLVRILAVAACLLASGTARARPRADRPRDDDSVQVALPFQIGIVGYLPRVRIGLRYGRRFADRHWLTVGAAALLDRGDHATFGEDPCGRAGVLGEGLCKAGTVAGGEGQLGYVHWFRLPRRPRLVPLVRGGVTGGWWRYPNATGLFQHQDRDQSWMVGGRVGSGLRGLVRPRLALGLDVDFTAAFARHLDAPLYEYATWSSSFLLGAAVLTSLEHLF